MSGENRWAEVAYYGLEGAKTREEKIEILRKLFRKGIEVYVAGKRRLERLDKEAPR